MADIIDAALDTVRPGAIKAAIQFVNDPDDLTRVVELRSWLTALYILVKPLEVEPGATIED